MSATKRPYYHRRIRTTQEIRENLCCEIEVRGKRRRVPDSWDDISQSHWRDRSWKRLRKTKYKVVK